MSAYDLLLDAVSDFRADAQMSSKTSNGPYVQVTYHAHGASHGVEVTVAGENICSTCGASIDSAARKALDAFRRWADDSEAGLTHALEASIETARAERAAGGHR